MGFMKQLILDDKFKTVMPERIKKRVCVDSNGCWNWIPKSKHPYGYGKYIYTQSGNRFDLSSHRASWLAFKGEIPKGMSVCHNCPNGDNPACCNPDHLFLGTPKDNTRDMMKKKKVFDFVGEKNNSAILTEITVLEMRDLHKSGMSAAAIARKFNIKYFTCLDAVTGRNWRHI